MASYGPPLVPPQAVVALKSKELSQLLLMLTTTALSLEARRNIVNALAIP